MKIRIDKPVGEFPAVSARDLQSNAAQVAKNCKFGNGQLRPLRGLRRVNKPSKVGPLRSLFRWGDVQDGDALGNIAAVANTTPVQVTSAGHGRVTGQLVFVSGTGLALDDATYAITVIDANTFSLNGTTAGGTATTGYWVKENGYWFHSAADVDYARGPIAGDTSDIVYFTGEAEPRMTYSPIAVSGGGTGYPNNWYVLGVPAPTVAPTVTAGAGGGCNVSNQIARRYVYTFVTGKGEEGPPSPPSAMLDMCPGQTGDLSAMQVAPSGNYNITLKRIYRSEAGNSSDAYRLVAEIPVANVTYADSVATDDLGDDIKSTRWDKPPADLKGILMHPNGFAVGFSGNMLCASEFNEPHAWPYFTPMDHAIVAIGRFDNNIVVCTTHETRIVTGNDPGLLDASMPGIEHTCISKRSMKSLGEFGVVFASPVGLISISAAGSTVATAQHYDYDAWQALKPSSIHGYVLDGKYVGFYDTGSATGGFIFDPARPDNGIVRIDMYATAGYVDPRTEQLYLVINDKVERFEGLDTFLSATWKSALFETLPHNLSVARVIAPEYSSLTFKLFAGGVLRHTKVVTNGEPFRLPGGYLAETQEIEITGASAWDHVVMASAMEEL